MGLLHRGNAPLWDYDYLSRVRLRGGADNLKSSLFLTSLLAKVRISYLPKHSNYSHSVMPSIACPSQSNPHVLDTLYDRFTRRERVVIAKRSVQVAAASSALSAQTRPTENA